MIHFKYKESLIFTWVGLILFLIIVPLFVWGIIDTTDPMLVLQFSFGAIISFSWLVYLMFVIIANWRLEKFIKIDDEELTFYKHQYSKTPIAIPLKKIHNQVIYSRKGIKVLKFLANGKTHRLPDQNLTPEEFSKVCNIIVKESTRCKACQSTQIAWEGSKGHCYNCETISPLRAEDFDWNDAYQA